MSLPRRLPSMVAAAAFAAAAIGVVAPAAQAPAAHARPQAAHARAADCTMASVVSARGTFEPQDGSWLQQPIGDQIAEDLPGQTTYTELQYPASPASDSPDAGVRALVSLLNTEAAACPDQRYVLLGYSQGATVVGDALVAPGERRNGQDAGELSDAASTNIAAIVLFGDPGFVGSEPFNAGTFDPAKNGAAPREKGALDAYAARIKDFCVGADFACQEGGGVLEHLAYFTNGMPGQGAEFAVRQLAG